MQGPHLRKYGAQATIDFELYAPDGVDFVSTAVYAAGDVKIVKDEGAEANTTNGFVDEGTGYSITLTATEMQAARIVLYIVDQTATKVWLDKAIVIETYGNASAQHAVDLDDSMRAGLTALPNAAADAAGGLPISDAGGLDMDSIKSDTAAILIDTAEIGVAGAGLTDLGGMSTTMKAQVNAEVVDTLATDTYAEPSAAPAFPLTLKDQLGWITAKTIHKVTQDGSSQKQYKADGTTVVGTEAVTDDGTTTTKGAVS